ncbi:MAG: VCBS domain-containing protein [Woeseiaceae bacterium]|nr:VCBS domain-containing protein [Woeseiaceae bacterium]
MTNYRFYVLAAILATLVGCGSDRDSVPQVGGSNGVVSISGDPVVGGSLFASVTDSDGVQSGSQSYQWYSDGDAIPGATTSGYRLTSDEGGEAVTVIIRYTDDNGLRETVESDPVDIQAAFDLAAVYFHGLVDGALCDISAVDATGVAASTPLASGTTSAGLVSFGPLVPVDGTALISCTGGTYVDESSGNVLDAPDTRAVINVVGDALFTVSPLTEIATQLAIAAGDLNTAISTFNAAVGVNFGVSSDITAILPTELVSEAALNDDAGRYATALALISQLDANDAGASAGDIINDLGADLADGTFSTTTLDDFNTAVVDLGTSAVASNLNNEALLVVQSAINNAPEPAVFDGLSATIPNDQTMQLAGNVTVTDVNFNEDRVVAQTDVQTTYGTFSIEEGGAWTYVLDTTDTTVAGLEVGQSVNDTIALTSVDGTMANLVIRITALTQVAEIRNTINGDTGELRLNLDPHLLQGRLSFSFLKTDALADDGNQKDAYITLYGSSGSSSESLVDLRIQGQGTNSDGSIREPRFLVRNTDNAAYPGGIIEAPFTPNEFYDIEIIWDMAEVNQITILINGEALGGGPFSTAAVVDSDFVDLDQWFSEGVERIQWRFGDNGTTIPFGSYYIDNVFIYSDTAGTVEVFRDDFENYFVGDSFAGSMTYPDSVDAFVSVFDAGAAPENSPAAFFNLVGAINSDVTDVLMDMVTIIDPDPGEDLIVEQTGTVTQYGTFSILPSGTWEYTLDTMNPTVAALVQGDRITDTIQIESVDGTTADLVITINGVGGAGPSGDNKVAVIIDTDPGDTGELRYALGADGPLAAGRVELKIKRLDDSLGNGDAFITLYNSNTNNAGAILDFRIRDDSFGVRNPSSIDTSALPHTLDEFMDVRITWEYPGGDTAQFPEVTISVDGVSLAPFTPDNSPFGGVTHVSVRFGDNSGVREDTGKVSVDDLAIYSDPAGFTEVFSDDFESYLDGDSLDTDNAASPYNSSTSEATVETIPGAGGPGSPGNKLAEIIDTDPGDTGELRYALGTDGPLAAGRLEVAVKRLDDSLGNGDAFITLFNSNTNNAGAILDFRIRDDSFAVRNPSSVDTSSLPHTLDAFMDVLVTWEYPGGDTTLLPEVTISVDGVALAPFTPDNSPFGGVTHVAFRFGDNSGVREATGIFSVDDLAIYSDKNGLTGVFSDDFESYLEGDSLDTDNAASPYNSSTNEATVGAEEGDASGPGTPGNKIAEIIDTNPGDTGELRYALDGDGPITAGRVEASVKRLDDSLGNGDAFITLFNSDTNNAGAILDFRIRDDSFGVRNPSSVDTSSLPHSLDAWMDVIITWQYPSGDPATTLPEVTITVDGVSLAPFTADNSSFNGVTHVSFRFGDNSGVREATGIFSVDELAIYSDMAGTTEVFTDDFESYLDGDSLDTDNAASPYNSSTSEATVGVEE